MLTATYRGSSPRTTKLPKELIATPDASIFRTKAEAEEHSFRIKREGLVKRTRILHRNIPVFGARVEVWVVAAWI